MAAANGVVTADAKAAFDRALALDTQDVMARFYLGMAADQDGRRADAEKIWGELLAECAAGRALDRGGPPRARAQCAGRRGRSIRHRPGAGAAAAPAADHDVNAMVERLADRLKKDGSDVPGWLQLVRSYRVLGQNDKVQAAIADARRALANDPDKLRQFAEGSERSRLGRPGAPLAPPAAAPGPTAADVAAAPSRRPRSKTSRSTPWWSGLPTA